MATKASHSCAQRCVAAHCGLDTLTNHPPQSPEAIRAVAQHTLAKLKSMGFGPTPPSYPLPGLHEKVFAKMRPKPLATAEKAEAAAK